MTTRQVVDMRLLDPWHLRSWPKPSRKLQVAFVPGRARDAWEGGHGDDGLLHTAAYMHRCDMCMYIALPGTIGSFVDGKRAASGYPGFVQWYGELLKLGVEGEVIFPTVGRGFHTQSETDDFVELAKEHGWTEGAVIMSPHQTLRVVL